MAHFKQYCDVKDPLYIYKINDNTGNPDRTSFVFKLSTLKAKIAINMDRDKKHFLAQEFCFFDGKHKRTKGYVTLTASVYHPLLRRQIPLAAMESVSENTENVTLFWELFNEVIEKVSNGEKKAVQTYRLVHWHGQTNQAKWCNNDHLFPLDPDLCFLKHRYSIAGLIKAPDDLIFHPLEKHQDIIKQIIGVSVP